ATTPTISWNVDTDGFWDVAANWKDSNGVVRAPNSSDDALIDRGSANPVVTIRGDQTVHTLFGTEMVLLNSGSLTIQSATEFDGDLTIAAALNLNAPLTLGGHTTWSTGSLGGSGILTNTGTLTLTGSGLKSLIDFNLDNAGTLIQTGGNIEVGNASGHGTTLRNLA